MKAEEFVGKWVTGWAVTDKEASETPALVVGYNLQGYASPLLIVENLHGWGWTGLGGSDVCLIECDAYSYAIPSQCTIVETPEGELDYDTDGSLLTVTVELPGKTIMSEIIELEASGYRVNPVDNGFMISTPSGAHYRTDTITEVKP
jgi:hypothetical protein